MDSIKSDLLQVRKVRTLRADILRRKQRACDLVRQQAYQSVVRAEEDVIELEKYVATQQRDSLTKLLSGNLVGVEYLMSFSHDKLKGMKQVIDAKSALNERVHQKLEVDHRYEQASALAVAAEKKLIGLDELIGSRPWK